MARKSRASVQPRIQPRKGTLAAEVAGRLRAAICSGHFPAGHPLREKELAAVYGISRVPLREALHRLEGEGLVEIRPNRGATVAGVSPAETVEIAAICRLLEGQLLDLAFPRLEAADLTRAARLLETLESIDDLGEWSRLNWDFHQALYRPAVRPLTVELLGQLRARVERALLVLIESKERRAALNREHRAILASLAAGKGVRARKLLDAHLLGARDKILDLVEPRAKKRR